jgi:hypothetical protein
MSKSIIKSSEKLKKALTDRWKELGLSHIEIADKAQKKGQHITNIAISIWIHRPFEKGGLSEEKILWLCKEYRIDVKLVIKKL